MPTVATRALAPTQLSAASVVIQSPPATPTKAAIVDALSGTDGAKAQRLLGRLTAAARQRVFATPLPGTGLVPLLDAAHRGASGLIAAYAATGAALNVRTDAGRDAIFTALFEEKNDTARYILDRPVLANAMFASEPVLASDIDAKLAAFGPHPTQDQIDKLAAELTSTKLEDYNSDSVAAIYLANVFAIKDTTFLKIGQGWNPEAMASQRMRTVMTMACRSGISAIDRGACLREAALFCEAARLDRLVFSASLVSDTTLADDALTYVAESIMRKLDRQTNEGNHKLVALLIPVSTPLHTTYLTLEPGFPDGRTHNYMLHYDNRGAGNASHQRADNGEVYPLRTSIPMTEDMRQLLKTTLVAILKERRAGGNVANIYVALNHFFDTVKASRGESWLDDPRNFDIPSYPQDAGNCNFANSDPGLDRRMGMDLAKRFRDFEKSFITNRCATFVDRATLDAEIAKNEERKARDHAALAHGQTSPRRASS